MTDAPAASGAPERSNNMPVKFTEEERDEYYLSEMEHIIPGYRAMNDAQRAEAFKKWEDEENAQIELDLYKAQLN